MLVSDPWRIFVLKPVKLSQLAKNPMSVCVRQPRQLHNDAKYGHQQGELNFWMPLTSKKITRLAQKLSSFWNHSLLFLLGFEVHVLCARTTLWVESSPDAGDFHPLSLEPGQVASNLGKIQKSGTKYGKNPEHAPTKARFHGTSVRHYVPANQTDSTRVSLDFRVGLGRFYDPDWRALAKDGKNLIGDGNYRRVKFHVPGYSEVV